MCVSALYAATALQGAGTVLSISQTYAQSRNAQVMSNYRAGIAGYNQQVSLMEQERIKNVSAVKQLEHARMVKQSRGSAIARAAQRGVALGEEGSSIETHLGDITREGQYDAMKIRDDEAVKLRNSKITAQGHSLSGSLHRLKAEGYNPLLDAVGAGLSGGARTFNYASAIEE